MLEKRSGISLFAKAVISVKKVPRHPWLQLEVFQSVQGELQLKSGEPSKGIPQLRERSRILG